MDKCFESGGQRRHSMLCERHECRSAVCSVELIEAADEGPVRTAGHDFAVLVVRLERDGSSKQ